MADEEESKTSQGNPSDPSVDEPPKAEAAAEDEAAAQAGEDAEAGAEEPKNRRARRAAASQARKQRLRERREAEAVGLDAQEMIDDAVARSTDQTAKWLKRNSTIIQGVIVAGVVVWAGWGIYGWRLAKAQASASSEVAKAVAQERGLVTDEPAPEDDTDPRPRFKAEADRLNASRTAFEQAIAAREGTGAAKYAQLALAAVHLDEGKHDDALKTFQALSKDQLASSDPEFRGRALEGVGLAYEGKGDQASALTAYQELEKAGVSGFSELALYRQARLLQAQGKPDEAKKAAEKLNEQTKSLGPGQITYIGQMAKTLSEELGIAVPAAAMPEPGKITPEQLEELQRKIRESVGKSALATPTEPEPSESETTESETTESPKTAESEQ